MSRDWDSSWQRYPASVPLPAPDGLATSKQRGPMASTWWSQRFVQVLESYGLGARMQRGRRYARQGQVLGIEVRSAVIVAQVQGLRPRPYLVTVSLPEPSERQWTAIEGAMASKVGFLARLLDGEVPAELEDVFRAVGVDLFPASWRQVRSECSCPDWENPCKHIAAVLYLFADQLDADPWLVLAWRGRTRQQLMERLRGKAPSGSGAEVAPWWPFAPGPLPELPARSKALSITPSAPARADEVLDALTPLDVQVGAVPLLELLRGAYPTVVGGSGVG
jgi:uncharacterized Zn finger protein